MSIKDNIKQFLSQSKQVITIDTKEEFETLKKLNKNEIIRVCLGRLMDIAQLRIDNTNLQMQLKGRKPKNGESVNPDAPFSPTRTYVSASVPCVKAKKILKECVIGTEDGEIRGNVGSYIITAPSGHHFVLDGEEFNKSFTEIK